MAAALHPVGQELKGGRMSDDSIEEIRVRGESGRVQRARAHDVAKPEAEPAAHPFGAALELHVCMGLNSCVTVTWSRAQRAKIHHSPRAVG